MNFLRDKKRSGSSLIDVVISAGIVVILFGAIYLVYFSLYGAIANVEARAGATAVLNQEVETMRNLPYASVGVVGGIPSGIVPAEQSVSYGDYNFIVATDIRNIDDPFDGTFPTDTAPADYKMVQLTISCPACQNFNPLSLTTTFAPKGLESATNQGSLFVNVFDSNGIGIGGANVNVVNPNVTPAVNLTDTTNNSGTLQLVGVPTSTHGYQIFVSKPGYSSAQTYPIGEAGNPDPAQPNITVAEGELSTASFAIDRVSALTVSATNNVCAGIAGTGFSISGSKTIGADVLKFTTTSVTNSSGASLFPDMEWDTYYFALTSSSYDLAGTAPLTPLTIAPSSTVSFDFVLAPKVPKSLLVTATDTATGAGITGASINLSGGSFSQTLVTGQSAWTDSNWSDGSYAAQSGGIDANSVPGSLSLLVNASGTYDTSATSWLISDTIDFGTSSVDYVSLNVNPGTEPPSTGVGSAELQLAANNDDATWNFAGPDGTAGSFYAASSTIVGLNGDRYLRYKIFLSTEDPNTSPTVRDVTIGFSSPCVPPAQVLFSGLSSGSYTMDATAPGYNEASAPVNISADSQSAQIPMTHQ